MNVQRFAICILCISSLGIQTSLAQAQDIPRLEPRQIEGIDRPNRIPGRFIVIYQRSALVSLQQPVLAQRNLPARQRSSELRGAEAAVDAESLALAQQLTGLPSERVTAVLGAAAPGFIAEMSDDVARRLVRDPRVQAIIADEVLPNVVATTQSPAPSWGLDRLDQHSLPRSHSYSYNLTGAGVHAYVMDSGVRVLHEDFRYRAALDKDVVGGSPAGGDCTGHGTQVASILGGTIYGVAKSVLLHSIRNVNCNGGSTTAQIIEALDWIDRAQQYPGVLNISQRWVDRWAPAHQQFITTTGILLDSIESNGFILVFAAGNNGPNSHTGDGWPSAYQGMNQVADAIVVSATDVNDQIWSGATVAGSDIFAPGVLVKTAWHTSDTATTDQESGTSLAAPHVAGVVALYLQLHPSGSASSFNVVEQELRTYASTNVVQGNLQGVANRLISSLIPGNTGPGGGPPGPGLTLEQKNALNAIIQSFLLQE